jgi:phosphate transport system substrate-binding protein
MRNIIVVLLATCLMCTAAAFADEIKVQGGGTAIATVFQPIKNRFEKLHGHTLSIQQTSAVKGLIALNDGKVDIATGAHPLDDLIAGAAKEGVVIDKSALVATQIEENRLIVIANRASEVGRLSKEQLKGIFNGKISNWKEVGGRDLAVELVWGTETQGQNIQFTRIALDGEPVATKRHNATNYRSISEVVSELPGGIGVVPLEITTPVTRSLDTVPITSPIYVITKGKPSDKVQEVIDFYKREYSFLN